jgi:hypothetical protein
MIIFLFFELFQGFLHTQLLFEEHDKLLQLYPVNGYKYIEKLITFSAFNFLRFKRNRFSYDDDDVRAQQFE